MLRQTESAEGQVQDNYKVPNTIWYMANFPTINSLTSPLTMSCVMRGVYQREGPRMVSIRKRGDKERQRSIGN